MLSILSRCCWQCRCLLENLNSIRHAVGKLPTFFSLYTFNDDVIIVGLESAKIAACGYGRRRQNQWLIKVVAVLRQVCLSVISLNVLSSASFSRGYLVRVQGVLEVVSAHVCIVIRLFRASQQTQSQDISLACVAILGVVH